MHYFVTSATGFIGKCVVKPVRIATRLGIAGPVVHALMPRVAQIGMNATWRMFPDSSAAKGDKSAKP